MNNTTSVQDLIEKLFDENISTTNQRFLTQGWYYQGEGPLECVQCDEIYKIFRKPYSSAQGDYEYWAIVCLKCGEINDLNDFESDSIAIFRDWAKEDSKISINTVKETTTVPIPSSKFVPTIEQQAILDAILDDSDLSIQALAGTGKTTTLRLLGESLPDRNGVYIAFNKSIVDEAQAKFPKNILCRTAHALAFRDVGKHYSARINTNQRMSNDQMGQWLQAEKFAFKSKVANHVLEPAQIAIAANNAVKNFCNSFDEQIQAKHVETNSLMSTNSDAANAFQEMVVPLAEKIWLDLQNLDGPMKFAHDHYLKMWQLSEPKLPFDFILFDEAQDADPVILHVINAQSNSLIVYCGDKNQAIYEWRGAVNALDKVHVDKNLWLTQSFRFGQKIADRANEFLTNLDSPHLVQGNSKLKSTLSRDDSADAILSRTNGSVIKSLMNCLDQNKKVAILGPTNYLIEFARACDELKNGHRTAHPDLAPFLSWADVKNWINADPIEAAQIKIWVDLVDTYGAMRLISALKRTVSETDADVVLSTAHRAKGREWNSVKLTNDFINREKMLSEDNRLAYVAVTRAINNLDVTSWSELDTAPVQIEPSTSHRINKVRPPII